jgi:hypothetical protein
MIASTWNVDPVKFPTHRDLTAVLDIWPENRHARAQHA